MRLLLLLLALAVTSISLAQQPPLLRVIAGHGSVVSEGQIDYRLQCPVGHLPVSYSMRPQLPYDLNTEFVRELVDANRLTINRATLATIQPLNGAGYLVKVLNDEHHPHELEFISTCLAIEAAASSMLALVKSSISVPKRSSGTATAFCPVDFPMALGGFSNGGGYRLQDLGGAPVWGTSEAPLLLSNQRDGQVDGPSGWQVKVFNADISANVDVSAFAVCGNAPALKAFVYSAPVPAATFGLPNPFSIFAPVPGGWAAIGAGFDGGPNGQLLFMDLWLEDGVIPGMLQWFATSGAYDSKMADVRAFMVNAVGSTPSGASSRAALAVLALPSAGAREPTMIDVVEFYHAGLDHYFITGIEGEIADLDRGLHAGWVRTGQSFKAYGSGSSGRTGRRPVCRAYGRPEVGLDSHFYSASPDECAATLINGAAYGYAWGLESSEVFQMDLPDPVTGACPTGGVPIHRIFNQRIDANHRYTTSTAIRDQMVAEGGIAEGYGPNAVVFCGLQ